MKKFTPRYYHLTEQLIKQLLIMKKLKLQEKELQHIQDLPYYFPIKVMKHPFR